MFYYKIKRFIFKIIKSKKVLLHLLLKLNTSFLSNILKIQ